jgi:hypothetical protein
MRPPACYKINLPSAASEFYRNITNTSYVICKITLSQCKSCVRCMWTVHRFFVWQALVCVVGVTVMWQCVDCRAVLPAVARRCV